MVKLGGSLAENAALREWVDGIAASREPLVIVPGGGPFADAVRRQQACWGFADPAAHTMALLAMEQFGHLLAALAPRLQPIGACGGIRAALAAGRIPVWLPTAEILAAPDVAAGWDITSDSLAAWLARRLQARGLVLVKSVKPSAGPTTVAAMQSAGWVDAAFATYGARAGCPVWLLERNQAGQLADLIGGQPTAAVAVHFGSPDPAPDSPQRREAVE